MNLFLTSLLYLHHLFNKGNRKAVSSSSTSLQKQEFDQADVDFVSLILKPLTIDHKERFRKGKGNAE